MRGFMHPMASQAPSAGSGSPRAAPTLLLPFQLLGSRGIAQPGPAAPRRKAHGRAGRTGTGRRSGLGALAAALLMAGCGARPGPAPPQPTDIAGFRQAAQAILTREHVPGAGIALVTRDGIVWSGGIGKADLATNQDVTDQTMFRVGSISKSFIALALLKLQEEGRINLNAPVGAVAPGIPIGNRWEGSHPITIAEVLEHAAGFDDMLVSEVYNLPGPPDISPLDVLRRFPQPLTARWPPGTHMAYSNPGYGVAGFLIEQVTKEKFEDFIQQNILVPLGMAQSSFFLTDVNAAHLAKGYEGNPPHPVPLLNIYLRPAGNLYSSPAELARLVEMFLHRGKVGDQPLVSEQSILRMEYPATTLAARAGLRDGYGFGNYADLSGRFVGHGHDGGIDGYLSTYRYLPEQGVGYVVLLNSSSSGRALEHLDRLALDYLTRGMTPAQPAAAELAPAALKKFTGYYEKRNPRNQLLANLDLLLGGQRVFLRNGALYERGILGGKQQLIPVGRDQFRTTKQPEASTIFTTDAQGRAVLADQRFYGVRVSIIWPIARLALIALALLLLASSVVAALVWLPRLLFRRRKGPRQVAVRAAPLAAVLWLALMILLVIFSPIWLLGAYDILSVGVWLAGWLFLFFSIGALLLALGPAARRSAPRAVWIHSLLVSIACCGIAGYFLYWHWIGARLWAP
jgi:CubicO group peptidase (beta-lactamase class C family)